MPVEIVNIPKTGACFVILSTPEAQAKADKLREELDRAPKASEDDPVIEARMKRRLARPKLPDSIYNRDVPE
ncbi:MAG: hypothetical protein HYY52_02645 [Candidatus Melainabacteria bacterium]|nr:hypothetical protein [Candidatus Melainabacteria bacterium]